jgi:two-component SAPR family response regulator
MKEIDYILEIEKVKKEADQLMMNKLEEINDLKNKISDLEESLKSKDYFEKPDYQFLVDENHRLEQQYLEVKADNMKLARQIDDQINKLRKSGVL